MTCNECRQQMILAEGEQAAPLDVRQHLTDCPACQDCVREERILQTHVRRLAETEHAPQALRDRVQELVYGSKTGGARPRKPWAAAAAVALLALGGFALKWRYSERSLSPNRLAQEFISDHLHYLPGREQILSESAPEVEKWFQERVDFAVRVPRVPAAELRDARVCNILGRKAALLHFRRKPDSTLISLFVAEEPKAFERQKKSVNLSTSFRGLNSTLWCHRGLVYSLVAALDDASLKQIAESVREQEQ
jgi:anti-sigma factor RsiW